MLPVKKTISHDKMSVFVKYPTGGQLRWTLTRSGERLTVAFSNDAAVLRKQSGVAGLWFGKLKGSNQEKIETAEKLLSSCNSGAEVILKMESDLYLIK